MYELLDKAAEAGLETISLALLGRLLALPLSALTVEDLTRIAQADL